MEGHRYRKRGWFGEPRRHYLAAKGIKTKHFAKRKTKSKDELKNDASEWLKLQFKPREIVLPSEKNEQKTAELIHDAGKAVKEALTNGKKNK